MGILEDEDFEISQKYPATAYLFQEMTPENRARARAEWQANPHPKAPVIRTHHRGEILTFLQAHPGWHKGRELAALICSSTYSVQNAATALRREGHNIVSHNKKGYLLDE